MLTIIVAAAIHGGCRQTIEYNEKENSFFLFFSSNLHFSYYYCYVFCYCCCYVYCYQWGKYGPSLKKEANRIEKLPVPACIFRKYVSTNVSNSYTVNCRFSCNSHYTICSSNTCVIDTLLFLLHLFFQHVLQLLPYVKTQNIVGSQKLYVSNLIQTHLTISTRVVIT